MLLQTTCPSWALVMSFPSLFSLGFEECLIAPLGPILLTVLHRITMSRSLPPGTIPSSSNNTQNGLMLFLATEPGDPLDNVKTTGYMLHINLLGGLFIISKSARPKEQSSCPVGNWHPGGLQLQPSSHFVLALPLAKLRMSYVSRLILGMGWLTYPVEPSWLSISKNWHGACRHSSFLN